MKPPKGTLSLYSHIISIYSDDLINIGLTLEECIKTVLASIKLLNSLELYYPPRSTYILYSKMKITLTDTKKETLKAYCSELLHKNNQIIRYIAKVIGLMTSSLPRVKYGAARYRYLEQDKKNALKLSKE